MAGTFTWHCTVRSPARPVISTSRLHNPTEDDGIRNHAEFKHLIPSRGGSLGSDHPLTMKCSCDVDNDATSTLEQEKHDDSTHAGDTYGTRHSFDMYSQSVAKSTTGAPRRPSLAQSPLEVRTKVDGHEDDADDQDEILGDDTMEITKRPPKRGKRYAKLGASDMEAARPPRSALATEGFRKSLGLSRCAFISLVATLMFTTLATILWSVQGSSLALPSTSHPFLPAMPPPSPIAPAPSPLLPPSPSFPPPSPAPPIASLLAMPLAHEAAMSSQMDGQTLSPYMCADGDPSTVCSTMVEKSAWVSVRAATSDSPEIHYVGVFNRPDREWQYLLGSFEIWLGTYYGDSASALAHKCGSITAETKGVGPFVVDCRGHPRSGSFVTVKQTGTARPLSVAEVSLYVAAPPPPSKPPPLGPPPLAPPNKPPAMPAPYTPPPQSPGPQHPPPSIPPVLSPPSTPPAPFAPETGKLSGRMCSAMLKDQGSRLRQIWGPEGWKVRRPATPACWGRDSMAWFNNAKRGAFCGRNWYEGNPGSLGASNGGPDKEWVYPHFTKSRAPALLGFDESIDEYNNRNSDPEKHGEASVLRNVNILSLYPPAVYNTCQNFEWQVCAARGMLPGQGGRRIRFAFRPRDLDPVEGPHPLGSCEGYHPAGCYNKGYASSDIFYLEVCIFNEICENGEELFHLNVGEDWQCRLSDQGFARLKGWLFCTDGSCFWP